MNEFKFRAEDINTGVGQSPDNEANRNPGDANPDPGNPKPEEPVIVDPDVPPVFPVSYKRGDCNKDPFDVVPCLSCQIAQKPIAIPLSVKASQLLRIMEVGCAIPNKSDPAGYKAPSRDTILKFVNRASEKMYPASTPTARQKFHLTMWIEGSKDYLKRLFGGLWYHPPYSDDFETYFGLEPKEARYLFCYGAPANSFAPEVMSPIFSIEYFQCMNEGFGASCRERPAYVQANVYRDQLHKSIQLSLNDPFNDEEMVPANKCHWETMTGFYNVEMETKIVEWTNKGYEMAVYFDRDNPRCEKLSTATVSIGAKVIVAGKLCTDL